MFEFLVTATVIWMLVLALVGFMDRLLPSHDEARPNTRLPEREYELLGDDYREVVAEYFARKAERDERKERAIRGR